METALATDAEQYRNCARQAKQNFKIGVEGGGMLEVGLGEVGGCNEG